MACCILDAPLGALWRATCSQAQGSLCGNITHIGQDLPDAFECPLSSFYNEQAERGASGAETISYSRYLSWGRWTRSSYCLLADQSRASSASGSQDEGPTSPLCVPSSPCWFTLAMWGRNRPLVLVETCLPAVSSPWLEGLPAQSLVLQAGEDRQPADTELVQRGAGCRMGSTVFPHL